MSVNLPPNPNVATFNNLYWIFNTTQLTQAEADLLYLKFPVAQGTENLQTTNVNGIMTCNDDVNFADGANITTFNQTLTDFTITSTNPPLSTATQPASNDSSTKMPTTAWVQSAIAGGGSLPTDTLSQVLVAGNNAGATSIDMNNNNITNVLNLSTSTANFGGDATFSATSDIIQIAGSQILQQPASTGISGTGNIMNQTVLRTSTGQSGAPLLEIIETTGNKQLYFIPNCPNDAYGKLGNAGDFVIAPTLLTDLVITNSAATGGASNGIRVDTSQLLLGYGGVADIPTNNITFNTANGITLTSPVPPLSTAVQPASSDSSTKMPTTAWTQGAIDAKIPASLLGLNNTWTGTQNWTNTTEGSLTSSATQPASSDSSTKMPTTAWVQSAIASHPSTAITLTAVASSSSYDAGTNTTSWNFTTYPNWSAYSWTMTTPTASRTNVVKTNLGSSPPLAVGTISANNSFILMTGTGINQPYTATSSNMITFCAGFSQNYTISATTYSAQLSVINCIGATPSTPVFQSNNLGENTGTCPPTANALSGYVIIKALNNLTGLGSPTIVFTQLLA